MSLSMPSDDVDGERLSDSQTQSGDVASADNAHLRRALTEPMLVYDDHPDALLDCEAVVYNEDREYTVNLDVGFCSCPAHQHHCHGEEPCKHLLRARLAREELAVPGWVEWQAVDDQLCRRLGRDR